MFSLMICLLSIVYSQASSQIPTYSRIDLRGLKRIEGKRIQALWIEKGFSYIANSVINAAKQGIVQYTTEPWEGCESFTARESIIDRESCEIIINGIMTLVSNHFPDSEIIYDDNIKQYTLKWD